MSLGTSVAGELSRRERTLHELGERARLAEQGRPEVDPALIIILFLSLTLNTDPSQAPDPERNSTANINMKP